MLITTLKFEPSRGGGGKREERNMFAKYVFREAFIAKRINIIILSLYLENPPSPHSTLYTFTFMVKDGRKWKCYTLLSLYEQIKSFFFLLRTA